MAGQQQSATDVEGVDGYLVPVDPAEETGCDSCQ
ncbi:hypothetical protein RR49_00396 [Microbacterium ginsengisoli]|jgi:hypothetical protein|uniref:Uncharacterized protein n=1 Tax=Microbacterium ginsengisoli TaxID=400772 RepID=A0A0F0LXY5_9MICO|nr:MULTISPECIES: hypothetical protein [Micrococcales]KJL40893.1 hypothetical protein RR49_00396 [Microbacterium ginsengisoli]MEA1265153.1 ribonucleotide-diphosphate reductase subunit beta [Microbacterium sp. STF-2]MEE2524375.1 ribonucleotide-diphosphate reductase subunit beta [Pseudarthrobacter sp. J47]